MRFRIWIAINNLLTSSTLELNLTKMIEFTKRHEESGRRFEFCFREIYCTNVEKFFVLVRDNGHIVAQFEMVREPEKNWRVLSPAPQWVQESEPEIVRLLLSDGPPMRKLYHQYGASSQQYEAASNQQPSQMMMRAHTGSSRQAV